jgi:phosphoribosyl-dephospho-CoA transferase
MRRSDVISTSRPPKLDGARPAAPHAWQSTLDAVHELAAKHVIEIRVFGSLAWRVLTGLDYLTDHSDLDLLLPVHGATDFSRLTQDLAQIEVRAPMRLDGELIAGDGTAVSWREFHVGAREILARTASSVALIDREEFVCAGAQS